MLKDTRLNGCPHLHGGNSPLVRLHQTHGPRSWGARVDDATEDSHIAPAAPSSGRATAPAAPVSLCCQNPLELCHHLLQWQEHMLNSAVPLGTWKKLFPHTAHNLGWHNVLNGITPFLKHHTAQVQQFVQDSQSTEWLQQSRKAWAHRPSGSCAFASLGVFGYELRQLKHLYITDAVTIFPVI